MEADKGDGGGGGGGTCTKLLDQSKFVCRLVRETDEEKVAVMRDVTRIAALLAVSDGQRHLMLRRWK